MKRQDPRQPALFAAMPDARPAGERTAEDRYRAPSLLDAIREAPARAIVSYASDGRCHNAEPGTYGHECGKAAVWVGRKIAPACPGLGYPEPYAFESGFCDDCRQHGHEARAYRDWRRQGRLSP